MRKRKFSLMFEIFCLIFSDCSLMFEIFCLIFSDCSFIFFAFARCECVLTDSYIKKCLFCGCWRYKKRNSPMWFKLASFKFFVKFLLVPPFSLPTTYPSKIFKESIAFSLMVTHNPKTTWQFCPILSLWFPRTSESSLFAFTACHVGAYFARFNTGQN